MPYEGPLVRSEGAFSDDQQSAELPHSAASPNFDQLNLACKTAAAVQAYPGYNMFMAMSFIEMLQRNRYGVVSTILTTDGVIALLGAGLCGPQVSGAMGDSVVTAYIASRVHERIREFDGSYIGRSDTRAGHLHGLR